MANCPNFFYPQRNFLKLYYIKFGPNFDVYILRNPSEFRISNVTTKFLLGRHSWTQFIWSQFSYFKVATVQRDGISYLMPFHIRYLGFFNFELRWDVNSPDVTKYLMSGTLIIYIIWNDLTHWGQDKMAPIFQTIFSNVFFRMRMYELRLRFHWTLFQRFELTIFQHWFR